MLPTPGRRGHSRTDDRVGQRRGTARAATGRPVVARGEPQSVLARALLPVARETGVRGALDAVLRTHLRGGG
ncbi:hypothetical protein SAV14893_076830 [Streptomyces avermitilis]|uniref:Uncharacterized protein n=1 Tax=Streptomyces avermitilis TaxID=33903 RepID=A0A4D4MH32_STRAX|nr:hypothetical protein SAV14893_076830 [Streptomyces avermitilis]GDY71348.1 hypothetical protein SAV31267_008330 [Streptomyces avermitilis]